MITVGELIVRALEAQRVSCAFGVISIHNMPILDAFHRREKIRFVSARGEAGACNMADAHARVTGGLGVVVTSTGTGAGNAAEALIEALTAGTPLLHPGINRPDRPTRHRSRRQPPVHHPPGRTVTRRHRRHPCHTHRRTLGRFRPDRPGPPRTPSRRPGTFRIHVSPAIGVS